MTLINTFCLPKSLNSPTLPPCSLISFIILGQISRISGCSLCRWAVPGTEGWLPHRKGGFRGQLLLKLSPPLPSSPLCGCPVAHCAFGRGSGVARGGAGETQSRQAASFISSDMPALLCMIRKERTFRGKTPSNMIKVTSPNGIKTRQI